MRVRLGLAAALFAVMAADAGAVAPSPAPDPTCTLVASGRVWTPTGFQDGVDVLIRGERIVAVAPGLPRPTACAVVGAAGKTVTPGFVEVATHLGLLEVDLEARTVDTDLKPHREGPDHVRASVDARWAYNPRSSLIPVARAGGLTSAVVRPRGGIVSGRGFWVDLACPRQACAVRRPDVAMFAQLGGGKASRAASFHALQVALSEAREWTAHEAAWRRGRRVGLTLPHRELAALAAVIGGTMPLAVSVERASDIEALLALTAGSGIRLIVVGGSEAWLVSDQLRERGVPVVVDPLRFAPGSFDQLHARPDNARLLDEAGVSVILATRSSHHARKLRQLAGNAVREGLPYARAMQAITSAPATAFGMADDGVLRPGAVANVVVWTGDPFELSTAVSTVVVRGQVVPPTSRQDRLYERYRRLPASRLPSGQTP